MDTDSNRFHIFLERDIQTSSGGATGPGLAVRQHRVSARREDCCEPGFLPNNCCPMTDQARQRRAVLDDSDIMIAHVPP